MLVPMTKSQSMANLSAAEARDLCLEALVGRDMPAEDARMITDVLVEAELWGKPSHGLSRVPTLSQRYRGKKFSALRTLKETAVCLHLDAGARFGYVALHHALEIAVPKARAAGLCVVGIRNSDHAGMAGYYAWRAAEQGLICVLTCDCFARTAPFGASSAVFGTNPIACGLPMRDEPVILDFSIAEIPSGKLLALQVAGKPAPEGACFDPQGKPTTSPKDALAGAVKAFGGHKGSGIALVSQLLSTAFVGAAAQPSPSTDYGYFLALLKPDLFVPIEEYRRIAQELLEAVKNARPESPGHVLHVPGERSFEHKRRASKQGIRLSEDLVAKLRAMASGVGSV